MNKKWFTPRKQQIFVGNQEGAMLNYLCTAVQAA
jgi:hypothetical protein